MYPGPVTQPVLPAPPPARTRGQESRRSAGRRLYGLRSGAEGTIEEFTHGHRGRRCRYRGLAKTHVQHVLTALAINVERLSRQEPVSHSYRARPPTAFQQYLDARSLPPCGGGKASDPGSQDSRQSRPMMADPAANGTSPGRTTAYGDAACR